MARDWSLIEPQTNLAEVLVARLMMLPLPSAWPLPLAVGHPACRRRPRPFYLVICPRCYGGHEVDKSQGQWPMEQAG